MASVFSLGAEFSPILFAPTFIDVERQTQGSCGIKRPAIQFSTMKLFEGAADERCKNIRWVVKFGSPILAMCYGRAAKRDENSGLPFTAAMEWRKAAELSSSITLLANRYWREWERIMHLPRRLAEPIGLALPAAIAQHNSSSHFEISFPPVFQHRVTLQPVTSYSGA